MESTICDSNDTSCDMSFYITTQSSLTDRAYMACMASAHCMACWLETDLVNSLFNFFPVRSSLNKFVDTYSSVRARALLGVVDRLTLQE